MKLRIVALGHKLPAWANAAYEDYARRMPREFALEMIELKPEARDRGKSVTQMLDAEGARIATAASGCQLVALDEHGDAWTTAMLAKHLRTWQDDARAIAFVIGSADGLDDTVKREAAAVVALSALTLPHGMVRVVLAEQIYRAWSITQNHPYHRV